jgi:hypothetical protein
VPVGAELEPGLLVAEVVGRLRIGVPWGTPGGVLDAGSVAPAGPGRRLERGMVSALGTGRLPRRGSMPLSRSRRREPKAGPEGAVLDGVVLETPALREL